jgi:hypothetical protein
MMRLADVNRMPISVLFIVTIDQHGIAARDGDNVVWKLAAGLLRRVEAIAL